MSSHKVSDTIRISMLVATQTVVGCGIGLLLAGKLRRPTQKVTAASLFSIGFLLALPAAVQLVARAWNAPGSERSVRRSLDSIRRASGAGEDADLV